MTGPRATTVNMIRTIFTRIVGTSYTGSGTYICIGVIEKHVICLKDYRIRSFLSIQYVHDDLCKHLGIDSSTDHPAFRNRFEYRSSRSVAYSNLFLNAYINRHVHA